MIDRRDFFRYLGAGSAGMIFLPPLFSGCKVNGNGHEDSYVNFEGVMPIAVVSDCSRLLLASNQLVDPIRLALTTDINLPLPGNPSLLGSSIPFDDVTLLTVLEQLKQDFDPASDPHVKKLSLVMGWIIFHPLKKSMTGVFRKLVDQGCHYDNIRSYLDAYMIRQVSGMQTEPAPAAGDLQHFFNALLPRMITRLHTLKPDYQDGPEWVGRMSAWRVENKERMDRCGTLCAEENAELHEQVIRRYNVYNPDDRLIQLARNMTRGAASDEVDKLILSDPGNSLYTRALVNGFNNVMAAQEFFQGSADLGKLKKLL